MHQRLAAADRDHRCAQFAEFIDPVQHLLGRDRLGEVVEFVAVRAGQIATPDRNQMRQQRVVNRGYGLDDLPDSVSIPGGRSYGAAKFDYGRRHELLFYFDSITSSKLAIVFNAIRGKTGVERVTARSN